jgi:hypothetical protein
VGLPSDKVKTLHLCFWIKNLNILFLYSLCSLLLRTLPDLKVDDVPVLDNVRLSLLPELPRCLDFSHALLAHVQLFEISLGWMEECERDGLQK